MINKLAIVTTHPIQYQAPLFRAISEKNHIDLTVYFGSDHGIKPSSDPGFGKTIIWDIPILEGYRSIFLRNSRPGITVFDWRLDGPELQECFSRNRYDAVLIYGWNKKLCWQATHWAATNNIPQILIGESNLTHRQSLAVRMVKLLVFPRYFRRFRAFLAIGTLNRNLYRHYGVPQEKIFLAPYSVDNDFFADRALEARDAAAALRQNFGIVENDLVFLYVAKLIDRKRPLDLILAHHELRDRKDIHTIIVGDGPLSNDCLNMARKDGMNNVHLVGFKNQTELPLYYAAANVMVLPSEYETWGLVVNEAMACGIPCIVSNKCGCAPDMIIPGETGFTYPVGDVRALAHAMTLFSDRQLLKQMSDSARSLACDFRIDKTVVALEAALRSIHG